MARPAAVQAVAIVEGLALPDDLPSEGVFVTEAVGPLTETLARNQRKRIAWDYAPASPVTLTDGRVLYLTVLQFEVRVVRPNGTETPFMVPPSSRATSWRAIEAGEHQFFVNAVVGFRVVEAA